MTRSATPKALLPLVLIPLALAMGACQAIEPLLPPPPEELDLWSDAAAGVSDPALARLCADTWEAQLRHDPFQATYLGDPRYDDAVPNTSLEGRGAWERTARALLDRLRGIEIAPLDEADRLTAVMLRQTLENEIAHARLGLEEWNVDPLEGPHVKILNVASVQPHVTLSERDRLVARWHGFGSYVRQAARNLENGLVAGKVAPRAAVTKSINQLESLLAISPLESPLLRIAAGGRWVELPAGGTVAAVAHEHLGDARRQDVLLRLNRHLLDPERAGLATWLVLPDENDPLTVEERGEFLYEVVQAVEDDIYPALTTYHTVLQEKVLPRARDDGRPGLRFLPGGTALYRTLIHESTSLPMDECDPKAIHDYGLAEVRRIRAEIADLGGRVLGTTDVAAIQERLRGDPALHFRTGDEVLAKAREALGRARAAQRKAFGVLPATPCEVVPIPDYEAPDSTVAYYREPAFDGSRPGRYFVNTYAPETRTRYEAEVLAFHEAIPGHHTQIAIAQEREDLPRFRRHTGCTAFVEGWALYSERLADEMGLYSGDMDRLGMLSFDAWRASRLVVDTGIHALGWSREQAIEYLSENTLLASNNVENEVDRYIAWPGQALAYKIGQREILALRERAEASLRGSFRLPEFHDRVLANGALTLECLRTVIGTWAGGARSIEASSNR
jgi:uncharacterized protein (DUF885 family)